MKKLFALFFILLGVVVIAFLMKVNKDNKVKNNERETKLVDETGTLVDEWSELSKGASNEDAQDFFDFVKKKAADGSLGSSEGIKNAIREGGEKYGVNLSEEETAKIADTISTLEGLGFSTDMIVDQAEALYEEYGADYMNHIEDALINTAKQVAEDTAISIWEGTKDAVLSFFE